MNTFWAQILPEVYPAIASFELGEFGFFIKSTTAFTFSKVHTFPSKVANIKWTQIPKTFVDFLTIQSSSAQVGINTAKMSHSRKAVKKNLRFMNTSFMKSCELF